MEVNRQNTEVLTPHQPSERIKDLDVIRGFALFGILLINMSLFNSPLIYLTLTDTQLWTGILDVVVFGIISFLVWGKFFALFTFLFGIGFTIFMERAEKKRKRPTFIFLRRLLILLTIGLIHNIQENLPFIKKVWLWSLMTGLIMSTVKFISFERMDSLFPTVYDLTYTIGSLIGDPALCFFYATSIVLLMRRREWMLRLSPLGNVGRTALSNYLFQSIVCTTLFYSYGFGLYGQVGPAVGVVITLAIFSIQLVLSTLWLKKYRYGPIEWIWRKLTYGRLA
jgi:uncharacterized membrane protein YeiB